MRHSAGIIVIDQASKGPEPTVLCVRAYSNWDFPKGQLDPGESHIEAAVRELEEETTLTLADVRLIGLKAPAVSYGSGKGKKTATYFLADRISRSVPFLPVNPELGKPENDEYRWVPISQLKQQVAKRLSPIADYVVEWLNGQA